MSVEFGHYLICMALIIAFLPTILITLKPKSATIYDYSKLFNALAVTQFASLFIAFLCLAYAFLYSDFTVKLVAEHSHMAKPTLYKITALWGNHEGSILLWIMIMSLYGALFARFSKEVDPKFKNYVLAVQLFMTGLFLGFLLFTSNPFERVFPPPDEGLGLNPLLQDPGLAFHPPTLYMGYVGYSLVFSLAFVYIAFGKRDYVSLAWLRPWSLLAWSFLTLGIGLGSWWAYYELGWGGWWFWDPVENASLMPWILGTCFIHSLQMSLKRKVFLNWTILLAILCFSFSLLGTFLVRSGLLTSVHSFASDPERGLYLLLISGGLILTALTLFTLRSSNMYQAEKINLFSREASLFAQNILFFSACIIILLGTLYPYFLEAFTGKAISVGAGYFNATIVPIVLPAFILLGFSMSLKWFSTSVGQFFERTRVLMMAIIALTIIIVLIQSPGSALATIGFSAGIWVLLSQFYALYEALAKKAAQYKSSEDFPWLKAFSKTTSNQYGMYLAHIGIGIIVIAITGSSLWQKSYHEWVKIGDSIKLHPLVYKLEKAELVQGPNYKSLKAEISVTKFGHKLTTLEPEKRFYPHKKMVTTEAAIYTSFKKDIYVTISEVKGKDEKDTVFDIKIYIEPLTIWLWIGVICLFFGGILSIYKPNKRKMENV